MNSKSAGIYSITSKVNGKRYIGSAVRICDRWKHHLSDLQLGKHHSQYLQRHFDKYTEDDLVFAVVETVERGELSLQDFKNLLLKREQTYLDNWEECHFNSSPTAGSPLGCKIEGSKYYYYDKYRDRYKTFYTVGGQVVYFGNQRTEEAAIKEVEYMKTLTESELLKYREECRTRPRKHKKGKNYHFNKKAGKWVVSFTINGKPKEYGYYKSEQEAISRVNELRLELGIKLD